MYAIHDIPFIESTRFVCFFFKFSKNKFFHLVILQVNHLLCEGSLCAIYLL